MLSLAFVLFRHSIVAVAGHASTDSGNLQGVGGGHVSTTSDCLSRLRIQSEQSGPNDFLERIGSEPGASEQAEVRPPAIGVRPLEGWRKILGDISPPGMWPTPDGQDGVPPVVNDELRRRSLLTVRSSAPPPMAAWFDAMMHSSQDGEDSFLRQALVADKTYPVVNWPLILKKLKQMGSSMMNVSALGWNRIRLPGSMSLWINGAKAAIDDSSEEIEQIEHEQNGHCEELIEGLQQEKNRLEEAAHKFNSRRLLGDISPPGMWPDSDDDESQFSESVLMRRRRLLNMA
ncbi:unnamed protein product [Calypogeia fissa]